MFDKIDYKTVRILGREVRLSIDHRERSISARFNDGYPTELRLTGYLARRLAIGASVRVEYGGDEDVLAGLYLGPLRLYLAANHRIVGNILAAFKTGRRVTSIEASLDDRFGDAGNGAALTLRGNLWNDDHQGNAKSRAFSVDLLDLVFGKTTTSEERVIEEREVVVPLPEGSFTTKARLVERFVVRPGWPFKIFHRWVEFRETPAVVPRRKSSGVDFIGQGGPWTCVTGSSIEAGIAELVGRVLADRSRYGGQTWVGGAVPSIEKWRDSHEVSVWRIVDGKEQEVWRGEILHGDTHSLTPGLEMGADLQLRRHQGHGGLVLTSLSRYVDVARGGELIHTDAPLTLVYNDEICTTQARFKVYGTPIGPVPASRSMPQQGSVNAFDILAAAKAAGLHGVNGGPAIGRVGRTPLQGMLAGHVLLAETMDPQWYAANAELVAGARAVHPTSTFDVESRSWVEPSKAEQALMDPEVEQVRAENARLLEEHDAKRYAEQADVEEVLAQLDTTPPGPTEEAEGLAARERATEIAFAMRHTNFDLSTAKGLGPTDIACMRDAAAAAFGVDLGTGDSTILQTVQVNPDGSHQLVGQPVAVSAMSAVLGAGQPDLSPAPFDSRPWLPVGPLTVVIARGETRTTVRLPRAASYRIGAHKDAEIRLLGAHMVSALLEQDLGAVWITRRSDNVAVDLFGLDIGERVRLREGAEVQVGQLYTLTFTSNRGA